MAASTALYSGCWELLYILFLCSYEQARLPVVYAVPEPGYNSQRGSHFLSRIYFSGFLQEKIVVSCPSREGGRGRMKVVMCASGMYRYKIGLISNARRMALKCEQIPGSPF